jgi:hypothetical protein
MRLIASIVIVLCFTLYFGLSTAEAAFPCPDGVQLWSTKAEIVVSSAATSHAERLPIFHLPHSLSHCGASASHAVAMAASDLVKANITSPRNSFALPANDRRNGILSKPILVPRRS